MCLFLFICVCMGVCVYLCVCVFVFFPLKAVHGEQLHLSTYDTELSITGAPTKAGFGTPAGGFTVGGYVSDAAYGGVRSTKTPGGRCSHPETSTPETSKGSASCPSSCFLDGCRSVTPTRFLSILPKQLRKNFTIKRSFVKVKRRSQSTAVKCYFF